MWRVTITLHPLYIFQDRFFRTTNFAKVSKLLYLSLFLYLLYIYYNKNFKKNQIFGRWHRVHDAQTLRKDLASLNGGGERI